MLKLKLQYFGHLMRRTDSLEKTLMLGKTKGNGAREDEMVGWMDADLMDVSLSKFREMVKGREAWRTAVQRVTKSWTQLCN